MKKSKKLVRRPTTTPRAKLLTSRKKSSQQVRNPPRTPQRGALGATSGY